MGVLAKIREIVVMLEEDGWVLARTRGSHRQYKHPRKQVIDKGEYGGTDKSVDA